MRKLGAWAKEWGNFSDPPTREDALKSKRELSFVR